MPASTSLLPPTTSRPSLPPPQTFDLLSGLHPLLSRLLLPSGAASSSTSPIGGGVPASTSPTALPSSSSYTNRINSDDPTVPLSPKDFPAAVQQIHARIGKARQVAKAMPGVEMSVEEQEAVVRELEGEVRRGQDVLMGLARRAGEMMMAEGQTLDDGAESGMDVEQG